MKHFYRWGYNDNLQVAQSSTVFRTLIVEPTQYNLKRIEVFTDLCKCFSFGSYERQNPKPYKSKEYIERRYFRHPTYKYKIYGIENMLGGIETVLVMREIENNGTLILRIVDCIGKHEKIKYIGKKDR
ncbi:MAG: hypothetical protein ACLRZZ_08075 [Enterocloster sp.]